MHRYAAEASRKRPVSECSEMQACGRSASTSSAISKRWTYNLCDL